MKKIYLLLFAISLSFISFSQSPIATYDRSNAISPTTTGTVANISAVGFTRGSGIASSNGADFSTKNWNSGSQAAAQVANEYIQWSLTANSGYNIDINSLDIRLLRNNNGPQNWQIFYSLDGFATAGIPASTIQSASNTETNYPVNSLLINSGDNGTVTFRLYAWNANNNGGTFTIAGEPAWSAFTVTDPGTRVSGIVNAIPINSTESNIIASGFNPTDNINYMAYNTTSGLSTTNSIKIGEFSIQDGGDDLTDADLLPTILTDITFDITGDLNIAALAIFDGTTNVSESTSVTSSTIFSGINSGAGISAPDGGTNTFSVYATFNSLVTDNDQLELLITDTTANGLLGSAFLDPDAGGASTPIIGDDNRIEVTATRLTFGVQPSDVSIFSIMTPAPTILANDINSNVDLDHTGTVVLSSTSATFNPAATISVDCVAGVATFDTIIYSSTSSNESLLAVSLSGLSFTLSSSFEIFGYIITIANQDFDGSTPDWPYTSDIPFFDNGWGTDGYYGIINNSLASPLDYASFSENILGSHDLNDEGNGTAGLATVTFSSVDISAYSNVSLTFDYDITGYAPNDDAQYEVFFDGVSQGIVDLINVASDAEGTVNIPIPDIVNTIDLQVSVGSNGDTTFTGFDNFLVASVFDGLIYFSDAWTPSAPTNGTGSLDALVLDGTYSVTSEIAINNIIVNDAANIIVEKGRSIHVNGELVCNDNILLDSDSLEYSSLIVEGSVSGNITYSRHVNTNAASGGNDLISAPVSGDIFGDFATNNLNLFSNPSNLTEKLFGPFDKVTGLYLTYDTNVPAEAAVVLEPGIGYRAATTDNLNLDFSGVVNTENINVPIVIAGPNNPEWNLVGNPYPSYIMLSSFLAANNSQFDPVSSGVYGYDGNASDGWQIWNQAYSDANLDAVITPGQGFLVASGAASGTISFTSVMRTTGTSDDFIPGRLATIEHLQLELSSTNKLYKTDFYFTNNASLSHDPGYDSRIFGGNAPSFSIYSHLVENNVGNDLAIQSLGYSDFADITIPLGLNASQNQELTISVLESSLPESTSVYLEDTVANTITLLNGSDYTFTATSNISGVGRFFLKLTDSALSTEELAFNSLHVFATVTPKAIFIKGNLTDTTLVNVFDMQGRLVLSTTLESGSTSNQIDVSTLATGIYAVSVSNKSLTKTQKVIIK